ncbi:MAG: hypothetical protein QOF61_2817 [Acidobacteriota bacterium]|jgi:hypothetical protein|nr:hypothetical protein [Acidobacteriota bacterium]
MNFQEGAGIPASSQDGEAQTNACVGHQPGRAPADSSFKSDPHPGKPKILFIGLAESTHTHSWIDLLEGAGFNVRLFALPSGVPPDDWQVRTYITSYYHAALDPPTRAALHPSNRAARFAKRQVARARGVRTVEELAEQWLAKVVREWQPDVVHTLGLDPSGDFYFRARRKYRLEGIGRWVLQTRGGSDLALTHLDPSRRDQVAEVLRTCDQLLSDNRENFRIARSMGVREDQFSRIGTVPGTGGIDVDTLARKWDGTPSSRRLVLVPKVYECMWAKTLPVYEAIRLCWERIQPCEIHLLSMNWEAIQWYWALPEHIRRACHAHARLPRARVLEMMTGARVMLAPSLIDGTPNSMFEAMAAGALPIVSPLETITPVAEQETNVLFARNLYPHEIAEALCRAMSDDALVDGAAERNLELVRRLADRSKIKPRVVEFYETLAKESRGVSA